MLARTAAAQTPLASRLMTTPTTAMTATQGAPKTMTLLPPNMAPPPAVRGVAPATDMAAAYNGTGWDGKTPQTDQGAAWNGQVSAVPKDQTALPDFIQTLASAVQSQQAGRGVGTNGLVSGYGDSTLGVPGPVSRLPIINRPSGPPTAEFIENDYGRSLAAALAGLQTRSAPQVADASLSNFDATRSQQLDSLGLLSAAARGDVPSAAELQMQRGLDAAIAAQRSQAASLKGVSPALAQRIAAQGIAAAQSNIAGQTAQLRAQEQATARGQYNAGLQNLAGQDLSAAGMRQQTAVTNAQLQADAQRQIDAATQTYLGMGMSREQAEQQARIDYYKFTESQKLAERQLTQQGQLAREQMGSQQQIARDQATAQMLMLLQQQRFSDDNFWRNTGVQLGSAALGGAGVGLASKLASDRRNKRSIKAGDSWADEFLDALKPKRFRYVGQGEEHLGVMAQDLEKTRAGAGIVSEGPTGKTIDVPQALGRLLASVGQMHRRLKTLEGGAA